ncbi:MAG: polysaccharide deacetylase family protein [Oscillospiraceae bacterium]|nr:polysaccharide deacetylase family protein [Oscillospiraceae bacterium]
MRKIFLLSFDDGVIYDERFIEILNKYHIPCTFNLNSDLEDFVWYYEDRFPIRRLRLEEKKHIYAGHEIASHSLHHPWLTSLSDDALRWEVGEDCHRLRQIFGLEKVGFAVPFTACGEREVEILRPLVPYIRLSEFKEDFALPSDPYHIGINSLYNDPAIYDKICRFAKNDLPVSCFVMAGHTYEFEVLNQWEYIENLLRFVSSFGFEFMTTMDFVDTVLA